MIKKLLIFILSLVFVIGYSFALPSSAAFAAASSSETSLPDIQLDNGENKILPDDSKYLGIWGSGSSVGDYINNDMKLDIPYESYPNSSNLMITCKNGKIVKVYSTHNPSKFWTGNIDSVKITYGTTSASSNIQGFFTATCKPIAQPTKKLKETNIDYQTIKQKSAWKGPFSLTTDKPNITTTGVQNKLKAQKDIDNQPSFFGVVYLQLDLISNLSDSLINTKPNFDFSKLFKITSDTGYNFTGYNIWLSKFGKYSTKKEFVDAMSGAITLKDVGVAQDVINGLYDCANNNSCSEVIKFKHDILNTYDPYSLEDIQDILYKKSNNILDKSISYYNYLSGACNNLSSIQDDFLRNQTQNICNEILKQNIDDTNQNDLDNYNLGYGLGQRVKNLTTLKTNFKTLGTGVNLLGIYNGYYELTNLNVGLRKISNIKKATEESTTTGQYGAIRKIFENEKKNIQSKKIVKDNTGKISVKRQTLEQVLTPGTVLNNNVKTLPNFNFNTGVNIVKVGGNDITIINGTTVVGDSIADINNLGKDHGCSIMPPSCSNAKDSSSFTINLGPSYANKSIKLKFKVKVNQPGIRKHWEDCNNHFFGDYIKIYANWNEKRKLCYNEDNTYDEEVDNLPLDSDGKVGIKFKSYTTASSETADITDIKYEIENN